MTVTILFAHEGQRSFARSPDGGSETPIILSVPFFLRHCYSHVADECNTLCGDSVESGEARWVGMSLFLASVGSAGAGEL